MASEPDLKALQAQMASGSMPTNPQQAAQAQEKAAQEKQMREDLLTRLVSPDARERLANIMLVKPDKGKQLEDMIINMGRQGRLQQQLDDKGLKAMLEQISEHSAASAKITIDRRRFMDDDDSDIDLDGL
ncbi:hypothetical protein AB1Y20_011430 [Prymnesium parvum]|uniref:Programmed cell death protein 5 n=1 Tax=Prymnesium parvum TaxID=97485 RepID=A0AB34IPN7_PRYPA